MEALPSTCQNAEIPVAPLERHVLRVDCVAKPGIVAAVTTALADCGANLVESAQFWDESSGRFFLRISFRAPQGAKLAQALAPVLDRFGFDLDLIAQARKPRLLVMVSKFDHALLHLLYQIRVGWLNAEVAAIVSNHPDAADIAAREGVPFHYWPVTKETKSEMEAKLIALADETCADRHDRRQRRRTIHQYPTTIRQRDIYALRGDGICRRSRRNGCHHDRLYARNLDWKKGCPCRHR